ncbi:MAG: hypothetical protein WBY88_07645, partial [Desulfosarcina sp.]
MKSIYRLFPMLTVCILLATLTGCATQQSAAPAQADAETAFEPFHDIVDMAFVTQRVSIPMAEG